MKTETLRPLVLAGCCGLLQLPVTAQGDTLPAQAATMTEHWRIDNVPSYRENGFRGDVVLNGFWLAAAVDGDDWATARVPSPSSASRQYYREVTIPAAWAGRRVILELDRVGGALSVNDEAVPFQSGRFVEVDITPQIRFGASNALRIVGATLQTDLWLRSRPAATPISDSYLRTSVRNRELALDLGGTAPKAQGVELVARLLRTPSDEKAALEFPVGRPDVSGDGAWRTTLRAPLADELSLWTHRHPKLHYYTVELRAADGAVLDRLLPRRVGLREVWVENGRFMLNGFPVSIVDDVWEGGVDRGNVTRRQGEQMIAKVKAMGFTGAIHLSAPVGLEIADELGLLASVGAGSMVRFNIWDPRSGLTRMDGDERREDIERLVRRLREHPSILQWTSAAPYSLNSMHPQYAGQYNNTWEFFPLNRFSETGRQGQELFRQASELIRAIDSERPVATHNGPYSPVEVATRYLCDNLDLQEREAFFDTWFRSGPNRKAIWVNEFGTPFAGHQFLRKIDHQMPQGPAYPKIHLENLARLIGEAAYRMETDDRFPLWLRDDFYATMLYPAMQELSARSIPRYWRAWRTYGVSASAHHVLNENAYGPVAPENRGAERRYGFRMLDDPRVPGYSEVVAPEYFRDPEIDGVTPVAAAYFDAIKPLLGYIGGPDTHFTQKDHLFYAGHKVRKAYVVVNDLDEAVDLAGRWVLSDAAGKAVAEGPLHGRVGAGMRALTEFPIEFDAPTVDARTEFVLRAELPPRDGATLASEFAITVFPTHRTPAPQFRGTVWTVNISDDLTHESPHFFVNRDNQTLLRNAGIEAKLVQGMRTFQYIGYSPDAALNLHRDLRPRGAPVIPRREPVTEGVPKPGDLLIIPRLTLGTGKGDCELLLRTLERMRLDELVEQGVRVLVMEQSLDNLFGIQTENVRPRQAFIAAKGHPVFEGLTDGDLANWTGNSTLESAITAYSPTENRFPERLWHTSNANAVSTRTLVRPQVGAVRALAVSGFDLQESPLLEVVRGKGRYVFCQFDVSDRYGVDPAATRLFDNLLAYLASVPDGDPARGEVATVPPGRDGVEAKARVFRAAVPEGDAAWGITQGDLFFRESIYTRNDVTRALPAVTVPVWAKTDAFGYPQVVRTQAGTLATTLSPDLFETGWMKRKAAWVRAALVVNQGGSRSDGPALRHHGRVTDLYPHVWVEGFVHPYTSNIW